jgi:hypothetical protein
MEPGSRRIDKRVEERGGWRRGRAPGRIRALVIGVDHEIVEEWKWRGTPVWPHAGFVCAGATSKNVVKMTFANRASLRDPSHLFNSRLDGNARRAIDIRQHHNIDDAALQDHVRGAAVAFNPKSESR